MLCPGTDDMICGASANAIALSMTAAAATETARKRQGRVPSAQEGARLISWKELAPLSQRLCMGLVESLAMRELFRKFAHGAACAMGSSWAFVLASVVVVAWAVTGPVFNYSDSWQLVINTGTTIVTFLMVFLIQSTQNRDSIAIHLKLDELLRAIAKARTGLVGLEHMSEEELKQVETEFEMLRQRQVDRAEAKKAEAH
jgi:low affinity Fe/Cu permease